MQQDYSKAATWYRKSANQGHPLAQFSLGLLYAEGNGVPIDYVEAYHWFSLASVQGFQQARNNLTIAERRMTKEQVAEAQKLTREFNQRGEPKVGKPTSGEIFSDLKPRAFP